MRSALYELLQLYRLQAQLGERDSAAKSLNDICSNPQLNISKRAFAWRTLSQIGRTVDARTRLRRLSTRASTCAEQLAIGDAAIDIHDWSLARRMFVAVAKFPSTTPPERTSCASGAKVGLKERARSVLSSVDLIAADLVWHQGIEVLAACGQADRAIAICRDYIGGAEVYALDKMEALGKLGEVVSKEAARVSLVLSCFCREILRASIIESATVAAPRSARILVAGPML
jgi:hypothetical protein